MRLSHSIFSNLTVQLFAIQISTFIVPWLLVLWLSHMQSAESVGQFSYMLAILSPLCLLLASPSRNFLLSSDQYYQHDIFAFRQLLALAGLLIALVAGLYIHAVVWMLCIYLFKIAEGFFDLPIARALKDTNKSALVTITLRKWLSILALLPLALLVDNIVLLLMGLAILFFLSSTGFRGFQPPKITWTAMLMLFKASLPLSLSALVFSLYFNIPRYVLGQADEQAMLGVFTVASFLTMGVLVAFNTLMQSQLPKLKQQFQLLSFGAFLRFSCRSLGVVLVLFALLQMAHLKVFSEPFWQAHNNINTHNPAFDNIYHQVLWLSWGPLLFSFANYLFMVSGRHRWLLLVTVLNAVSAYCLGMWSFSNYSFTGLIWVMSLSGLLQFSMVLPALKYPKVAS